MQLLCLFYVAEERVHALLKTAGGGMKRLRTVKDGKCVPVQTCQCLPVDPTVTETEGLVLGSEDAGSINPFIVALIRQPQRIGLLGAGRGSELIGRKSAKSMSTA